MACGISSLLVQVTVVPAFTVSVGGVKVKLSIDIAPAGSLPAASSTPAPSTKPAAPPSPAAAIMERNMLASSSFERRVDDGEPLSALFHGDVGNAEHLPQLLLGDFHRAGRRGSAGGGLRERGRTRGVEGDVAFHLLHHLMDMAVEHGH